MKHLKEILVRLATVLAVLLFLPSLAQAHPEAGHATGFAHGFEHPLTGLDHIAAMVAVGLWAAQMGGRALWAVPLTFVSVMAIGGLFGMMGVSIPLVEPGIIASVLLLGLFITAAVKLPLPLSMAFVGLFAVFHGYAHGAEMPETASGLTYGIGFVLATAILHGLGILVGIGIQRLSTPVVLRFAGAAIVLCGVFLWIG